MYKKLFLICLGIIIWSLSVVGYRQIVQKPQQMPVSPATQELLQEIKDQTRWYLNISDTLEQQKLIIHAYVSSFGDRFTEYFAPEDVLAFETMINGDFEWIGAYIDGTANGIYIEDVLPGSPAAKAGLLQWDIIQSVNGKSLYGMTADEAVRLIRGPAGSLVNLDILSSILGNKRSVSVLREHIELPILTEELRDKTLIIHLLAFNDYSGVDVSKVLEKYDGQFNQLLIDLRDNGGGTLEAAVDVASLFFSAPKIVSTIHGESSNKYLSYGKSDVDYPVYILVNWQTASAAEILASALRVHLKSKIFGTQTYGKWSVQELFDLSNGGKMKITVAHWFTADGQKLDGEGITPDTVILPKLEDLVAGRDGQLETTLTAIQ